MSNNKKYQEMNNISERTARRYLFDLTKKELLKNEGDNKSSCYIFKNNVRYPIVNIAMKIN